MPSSFPENIPQICQMFMELKPKTILDIGVGRGKYGLLAKEYLKNDVKVDGLEIFDPYITPTIIMIYNKIIVGNALDEKIHNNLKYDLVLIIDVLEHWDKEKAHILLNKLIDNGCKIFVSTPRSVGPQGPEYGNEWERHVSQWGGDDFRRYPNREYYSDISFNYLLG